MINEEPMSKMVTLETSVLLDKSHKDPNLDDSGGPWRSGSVSRLTGEKLRRRSDEGRSEGSPASSTSSQSDGGENLWFLFLCLKLWACIRPTLAIFSVP